MTKKMTEDIRVSMTDRVGLARTHLVWHSVPLYAQDDAELDVLATFAERAATLNFSGVLWFRKEVEVPAA